MAIITTLPDLRDAVDYHMAQGEFAFDIETMGEDRDQPLVTHVVWLSLASKGRTDTIPMGHPNGDFISSRKKPNKKGQTRLDRGVPYEDLNPKYDYSVEDQLFFATPPDQLDRSDVIPVLDPLFTTFGILKIGHNIKFDIHGMSKYFSGSHYEEGIPGPYFDTMIASWIQDSGLVLGKRAGTDGLSLAACARRTLGENVEKGVGEKIEYHSFSKVAEYSMRDAEVTYRLYERLVKEFTPTHQWLMSLEMNVLSPVLEMERSGVQIDSEVLRRIHDEIVVDVADLEDQMFRVAGRKFNPRSNRDKQEVLFLDKKDGGQGIRSTKLTSGGENKAEAGTRLDIYDLSVDSEVLERNRKNPLASLLLEYAAKVKIDGTYVTPYIGGIPVGGSKPKDRKLRNDRIYAQFKQNGAETGRFSSSNPNLQNIPSRTPDGKRIRDAFVANPGELLVVADYSQIEPRIIASLSGDPTMISAYMDGQDVYQVVADRMSVQRSGGKTLVLAIAYGVGVRKIAIDIGCSLGQATELMDFFHRQFPRIRDHKRRVIGEARRLGYSKTVFGRRRNLDMRSSNPVIRSMAERQAYNHLIQGSAADIMKIALVNIHASLPDSATMLMTVHDEVVISTPPELVDEITDLLKEEMIGAAPRKKIVVPLVADVKSGMRWSDCK